MRGDHVYVQRLGGLYTHHGIDCGGGEVIHLTAAGPGLPSVRSVARDDFAEGSAILVRDYAKFFASEDAAERAIDVSPDAVVARARSRLGQIGFDLFFNNCEHFATWCRTGLANSTQIDSLWRLGLGPAGYFWHKTGEWMTRALD